MKKEYICVWCDKKIEGKESLRNHNCKHKKNNKYWSRVIEGYILVKEIEK